MTLEDRRRALMALGNGGDGMKITSITTTSGSLKDNIVDANIPLLTDNEIIIWNIKGTVRQSTGSVAVKCGFAIVQNGSIVSDCRTGKDMNSVSAPDSSTPSSTWNDRNIVSVTSGFITSTTNLYVGVGNTIDIIQIPYDIGWDV